MTCDTKPPPYRANGLLRTGILCLLLLGSVVAYLNWSSEANHRANATKIDENQRLIREILTSGPPTPDRWTERDMQRYVEELQRLYPAVPLPKPEHKP